MDILTIIATCIGALVALFPLGFVAYLDGGGVYHLLKRSKMRDNAASGLVCSVDTDCPPGFTCVNGTCVPQGS